MLTAPVPAVATARTLAAEVETELAAAAVMVAKSAQAAAVELVAELAAEVPVAKCPPCLRPSVVRLDQCFAAVRPSLDSSR